MKIFILFLIFGTVYPSMFNHLLPHSNEDKIHYIVRLVVYCLLFISFVFGVVMGCKKIFYDRDTKQKIERLEIQMGFAMNQLRVFDDQSKMVDSHEIPSNANIDLNNSTEVNNYLEMRNTKT